MDPSPLSCPFCPFSDSDLNFVAEHIEYCHPENGTQDSVPHHLLGSSSLPDSPPSENEESTAKYVDCPHGCGEIVTTAELSTHLDLHVAETIALDETGSAQSPPDVESGLSDRDLSSDPENSFNATAVRKGGKRSLGRDFAYTNVSKSSRAPSPPRTVGPDGAKRLGRSELGPHAHEKKMPSWLNKMLEKGGRTSKQTQITADGKLTRHTTVENETDHLIPVIAKLCEQDSSVQRAFLCSSKVRHICKMPREGGFCGYRNIQMLVSYLTKSQSPGHEHFPNGVPTILDLQDKIELAWDMGFNSAGRTETGGIRGTRKFIGTPESGDLRAYDSLYMDVATYFRSGCSLDDEKRVYRTDLPPIYFQHQGHSMTIIGFEIRDNGKANLLVFDPMFKTSPAMRRLTGTSSQSNNPGRLLKAYRRGASYLQKYKMFELLKMRASPNVIVTGTPGVGKTVHCEQLAQEIGLKHLSVNQVAKDRDCYETYDEERKSWVVDEDKLLDAIEEEVLQGGYLIDWHACDLFPKSWIDLVVVLRCPSTAVHYDQKLQENLDAEIFGVLLEEAREAFDEEIVVELNSEEDGDVDTNCARVAQWVDNWKKQHDDDN
ncbi:hypothetical protein N7466_006957 [Penicillium verhagenii]|uniref:uncharacterized protein n=1 Tax=Penicillium verhagenii TaxID=1562060 RepID=UPI0025453675|nr:uncharacterized protein N7466_006957 [Penicillium verhagenii]KAJ5928001.1 hypothetical protein N7466_006957 [Penicillium verhagenii]